MPIVMQHLNSLLRFTILGPVCQRISDWEYTHDEMVVREELATGSLRHFKCYASQINNMPREHAEIYAEFLEISGDKLQKMREAALEGRMEPFYGVGGGGYQYELRPTESQCRIRVVQWLTGNVLELVEASAVSEDAKAIHRALAFTIGGDEYRNLTQWENWVSFQAFSGRYAYEFSLSDIGTSARVTDLRTDTIIDVTNYSSW